VIAENIVAWMYLCSTPICGRATHRLKEFLFKRGCPRHLQWMFPIEAVNMVTGYFWTDNGILSLLTDFFRLF
jgi:hypothetical protein